MVYGAEGKIRRGGNHTHVPSGNHTHVPSGNHTHIPSGNHTHIPLGNVTGGHGHDHRQNRTASPTL